MINHSCIVGNIVENEDIAMNLTKESAKLVSFEDAAASNQTGSYAPLYIYC